MIFLFEERRAFVRTSTHTTVIDTDPDYAAFAAGAPGAVASLVRVWLARAAGREVVPEAYLGALALCPRGLSRTDLARLLRRLSAVAATAGEPVRPLRRRLMALLRRFRVPPPPPPP